MVPLGFVAALRVWGPSLAAPDLTVHGCPEGATMFCSSTGVVAFQSGPSVRGGALGTARCGVYECLLWYDEFRLFVLNFASKKNPKRAFGAWECLGSRRVQLVQGPSKNCCKKTIFTS